jgi:hypothetical protein
MAGRSGPSAENSLIGAMRRPFLIGLGGPRHVAAGHRAADVGPVGQVDREGDQSAADEHRPHGLDVGQVVAAHFWKIEEPDVAVAQPIFGNPLEKFFDGEAHDTQMDRDVAPLRDEPPVGVRQRRGEIARFLEQRRARRTHDDHAHLLGDRVERVADDLERRGMQGHGATSIRRLPRRSARQR